MRPLARLSGVTLLLTVLAGLVQPTPAYAAVCRSGAGDVCLCAESCTATETSCTCTRQE